MKWSLPEEKPCCQYRGEILPLEDEAEVLGPPGAAPLRTRRIEAVVTVLICLRPGTQGMRRSGMVVRQVLDITAGTLLAEDTAGFGSRLAMVRPRDHGPPRLRRRSPREDLAALQEVA